MRSFCLIESGEDHFLVSLRYKNTISLTKELYCIILYHEFTHRNVDIHLFLQNKLEKFSKKEVAYSLKKYQLLHDNYYFEPMKEIKFDTSIVAEDISKNFAKSGIMIVFESTYSCNLKCVYCCYGKYYSSPSRKNKKMDARRAINIIDDIMSRSKNNIMDYHIGFYGGEPLLNFTFIKQVVEYCRVLEINSNMKFSFSITTNGVLLDKYIDFLAINEFDLSISLDGSQYNNSFRIFPDKRESYSIIVSNIFLIREKYPKYYQKRVNFQTVKHIRNKSDDIQLFFNNTFDKLTNISPIVFYGLNQALLQKFYQLVGDESLDYSNHPLYKIRTFTGYLYERPYFLRNLQTKIKYRPSSTCFPGELKLFITTDGEILPCEHIESGLNIASCNQSEIYLDFNEIAKKYTKYFKKMAKICATCYINTECTQCMFLAGVANKDFIKCPEHLSYSDIKKIFTKLIKV